MPLIQSYSGLAVDLDDPKPSSIKLVDIAHALSLTNRFAGHTTSSYSVAEHSVLVSRLIPETSSKQVLIAALLHDAHEAYIGDVIGPVKKLIPGFEKLEKKFDLVIGRKFVPGMKSASDKAVLNVFRRTVIKDADQLMCQIEKHWLRKTAKHKRPDEVQVLIPYTASGSVLPGPLSGIEAEVLFLQRYIELTTDAST